MFEKCFIYFTWILGFFSNFLPDAQPPDQCGGMEVSPKHSPCWAGWWEPSSPLLLTSVIPVPFPPQNLFENPSSQSSKRSPAPNPFTDHAALSVPTSHMKHTARTPHPALLEAPKKLFSSLSSSVDWKGEDSLYRHYFKQPVTHVVRMAYQLHQVPCSFSFMVWNWRCWCSPRKPRPETTRGD